MTCDARTSAREPSATSAAGRQQREPLREPTGEREVVHRRDHRQPTASTELVDQLEDAQLLAEVEPGRGLVEQEQGRLLRERPREDDAPQLAARERLETPGRRPAEVEALDRGGHDLVIAPSLGGEQSEVRRPPEQHVLLDRDALGDHRELRDEGDRSSSRPPSEVLGRPTRTARTEPVCGNSPATACTSVVLPAPFGPITQTHEPRRDLEPDTGDDRRAAELDRQVADLERERVVPQRGRPRPLRRQHRDEERRADRAP